MKILFLTYMWNNNSQHGLHSGFHQLVKYAAKNHDVTVVTWGKINTEFTDPDNIKTIIVKTVKRDYLLLKRLKVSLKGRSLVKHYDVIHALQTDCSYFLPANKYLVTLHVLPGIAKYSEFKQTVFLLLKYLVIQKRALNRATLIACVSSNLINLIQEPCKSKTKFIPHGVDTKYWDPKLVKNQRICPERYILCIGSHGLNNSLLRNILDNNSDIIFVAIGIKEKIQGFTNIQYLYNVSPEDLRNYYHYAEAVLRPLDFATANNSILEALSMGKPLITTNIQGLSEYIIYNQCIFIENLQNYCLSNIDFTKFHSPTIRQHALDNFSWDIVFKCYEDYYYSSLTKAKLPV